MAQDLGGGRRAQIFAALVAITLPIGVTQATAGKNGWVEALWLLSLACLSRAAASERALPSRANVVLALAALGLGLMTKLTSWLFAGPIAVVAAARMIRSAGASWRAMVAPVALGIVVVCALTFPFLARNISVYGNPVVDPVARARSGLTYVTPAVIVSNVVRNAFFQLGTGDLDVIGREARDSQLPADDPPTLVLDERPNVVEDAVMGLGPDTEPPEPARR